LKTAASGNRRRLFEKQLLTAKLISLLLLKPFLDPA